MGLSQPGQLSTAWPDPALSFKSILRRFRTNKSNLWPVFLGHFLFTCLFTFPLIFNFNSALPGLLVEDRDQNLWNLWWVPRALLNLKNPFHTDFIYYPDGVSLYFHTLHPLNGILSFPVQLLFGLTAAYNFIVFFSFIMAGVGAYLLALDLCRKREAAFAASLIFTFAPYHLGTLKGLMQLISLEWLPFYLLFLLRATRPGGQTLKQRAFNTAGATFFLVLTALTDWYYVLFLLIFTGLYFIYPTHKPLARSYKLKFKLIPLILALFLAAMAPVLIPMVKELGRTNYYLPAEDAARGFSATLAAFFVPPTTSSFLGWLGQKFPAAYLTGPLAAQVYLGYLALLLAGVGLLSFRRARFWGLVVLVFWSLSLGPELNLNGPGPGWPMPFGLIQNWPVVKITRSPDRFIVISMLALAVCAAFGLRKLQGVGGVRKRAVWVGLACFLITLEFLQIPYPLEKVKIYPFFEQLSRDKADYSILELPAQGGFWSGAPRMAYQTIHHKRTFNGYISREFEHPFLSRTPGFQELTLLRNRPDIFHPLPAGPDLPGERSWYDAFSYFKVRYIVLYAPQNQKEAESTNYARIREVLNEVLPPEARNPLYKDGIMEVYPVPQPGEKERHPFIQIGEGWYEPELDADGEGHHRWAGGPANLNLFWEGPGERAVTLGFKLGLLAGDQLFRIFLDGKAIKETRASAIQQTVRLEFNLSPGGHHLDFYPEGPAQSPKSLGLNKVDTRKLLFYTSDLTLD